MEPEYNTRSVVDVAACLRLAELGPARLLTARPEVSRPVGWVAVIEWPVEDFVSPGDFVLTTGVGCDEVQLGWMIRKIEEAKAAAVGLSVGRGAPHALIPESVVAEAQRVKLPLIALPWRVRFSDVSRAIVHALYAEGYTLPRADGDLPADLTRVLLGPSGVTGIAETLESVVGSPVVVLDASLAVIGSGRAGTEWIADPDIEGALVASMVRCVGEGEPATGAVTLDCEGHGRVIVAPASARDGVLGWVVAAPGELAEQTLIERAVLHASTAVAIELLRDVAAGEAEWRARESFAWEAAAGSISSPRELAARATLLGLPLGPGYKVGIGLVETSDDVAMPSAREFARRMRRRLRYANSVVAVRENELLVCLREGEQDWHDLVRDVTAQMQGIKVSLGLAAGSHTLAGLAGAVEQARAAREVTRALRGTGVAADAHELGASMLLHSLPSDPVAQRLAREAIEPLEKADSAHHSDLLGTLTVFLEENGNVSAAARRLHLNRHSLIYRLRKISQLTGRDLDSHEQRLLLDISLRVRRLR